MKHLLISVPILCLPLLVTLCLTADAYERYHDPSLNDQGYCSDCHPGFKSGTGGSLHALHTGGADRITGNCDLCHTGSGRENPLIMWSTLNNGNGLGCTGCHGRDYGEIISGNIGGFPTNGKAKSSGYGLRKHHLNAGITVCLNCHADVNPSQIFPEYVDPPYYARADVSLGGEPLYACDHDDTANDGDLVGLDDDGDLLYNADDPDCAITADTHVIPVSTGGTVQFSLDAGAGNGARNYLVLGSLTGTSPGIPLPGGTTTVPLHWDAFTDFIIPRLNTTLFSGFIGTLNGSGTGGAQINAPSVSATKVGKVMHYAFLLEGPPWDFTSNPIPVVFVP